MLGEVERVPALYAQKFVVDTAAVAIVAAQDFIVAYAERRLTAIGAMRANGADMLHLPRPRLVPIASAGERPHGANVDASSAFIAFEVIVMVGNDLRDDPAIAHAQRAHSHALAAGAHAAVAQDAARGVEEYHWRPLLFVHVQLAFDETAFAGPIAEHHVLQFALAALIAHRAVQRMIGEQEFERALARLLDDIRVRAHHHALGYRRGAAHLQYM